MANLVDTIMGALPPSAIDQLSGLLGESPADTGRAVSGVVPALLGALATKAEHGGISDIMAMIGRVTAGGNPLDNPVALAAPGAMADSGFVSQLLGPQMAPMAAALAGSLGVKGSTIGSLLNMALPLVLGGIARALGNNPTADGVLGLLRSEKPGIMSMLPAGVGPLLAGFAAEPTPLHGTVAEGAGAAAASGLSKWLPWILAAIAALAIVFGMRQCRREEPAPVVDPAPAVVTEPAATMPVVPAGAGVTSDTREGRPVLIVFFDVGKSDVTADLAPAAEPVKAYLEANPDATIAVSGYNDPTGNAAVNAELSKNRAQQVAAALVAAGIAQARVRMEKPVETTGTGDTNAESRRVEVVVKE